MITVRLVRLIERNSDELTDTLLTKFYSSPRTGELQKVPRHELRQRCHEILRHLSDWLLSKSGTDIEQRYRKIGSLRATQGISLAAVTWGIVLMKEHIWDFLQREGFLRGPLEIYGALELQRLLDQFFDHAICYCVAGYEEATLQTVPVSSARNAPPSAAAL